MKKLIFLCLLGIAGAAKAQSLEATLDSIVRQFDRANQFHGSVLVAKGQKVLLQKGYGWANVNLKTRNEGSTIYPIGSITKQFTAAVILKLQEAGKLSVQDKAGKYFPALKYGDRITLHQLLTHTSGLFNYTNDTAYWYSQMSEQKLVDLLNSKPLDFEPGAEMRYCNSGYLLAGYIIEKLTGKKYEQVVREWIFNPLGMSSSGFDFGNLHSDKKATGYYDNGSINAHALLIDSTTSFSAGAIYSTVGDMNKWARAIHDKKIISAASWKLLTTSNKNAYGYGMIMDSIGGQKRYWHNGGLDGFVSCFYHLPDADITVVALSNYMQSNPMKLNDALSNAVLGRPFELPEVRNEIEVAPDKMMQYAGKYQLAPEFSITITVENNQLMARATGQDKFPIYPQKENFFFYKVVDAQIEFVKDASGKIVSLTLYQNGMQLKGEKQ